MTKKHRRDTIVYKSKNKLGGKVNELAKYLNRHIVGNVFGRPAIRELYATDHSILHFTPKIVALPENTNDIRKLVRFSNQLAAKNFQLPITVRGTGLDKTGAAIGEGMVISMEKLNNIEEIDPRSRLVRTRPGITLNELNTALSIEGLCLPINADPNMTIGGLIANCTTDDAANRYGGIFHYVERAEVVLANGDIIQVSPRGAHSTATKMSQDTFEGNLYRSIERIYEEHGHIIEQLAKKQFSPAGYMAITLAKRGRITDLLPLLFASQGTLGIITDVILRLEVLPNTMRRIMIAFHDHRSAIRFLSFAKTLDPVLLNLYDLRIAEMASEHGKKSKFFKSKIGNGLLVIVGFDDSGHKTSHKIRKCVEALPKGTYAVTESNQNTADFQELYSTLTSFLNDSPEGERAPIADDVYIPEVHLGEFFEKTKELEGTLNLDLPIYGSFATNNYDVRPDIDLTTTEGRETTLAFLRHFGRIVNTCKGSLAGGTPEGRVKAIAMPAFSEEERALYTDIKRTFDPNNILNPGVKLGVDLYNVVRHLRTTNAKYITKS